MTSLTTKPKLPETIIVHGRPSNDLLRYWAKDPEQNQCWGLDAVADELDRLTARENALREALAAMVSAFGAPYPPAEHGEQKQAEWASNRYNSLNAALAILQESSK